MSCVAIGSCPNNDLKYDFSLPQQNKSNKKWFVNAMMFLSLWSFGYAFQAYYCIWKDSQVSVMDSYFYPLAASVSPSNITKGN